MASIAPLLGIPSHSKSLFEKFTRHFTSLAVSSIANRRSLKAFKPDGKEFSGAPERTRTSDLVLRRHALYPTELRALTGCL